MKMKSNIFLSFILTFIILLPALYSCTDPLGIDDNVIKNELKTKDTLRDTLRDTIIIKNDTLRDTVYVEKPYEKYVKTFKNISVEFFEYLADDKGRIEENNKWSGNLLSIIKGGIDQNTNRMDFEFEYSLLSGQNSNPNYVYGYFTKFKVNIKNVMPYGPELFLNGNFDSDLWSSTTFYNKMDYSYHIYEDSTANTSVIFNNISFDKNRNIETVFFTIESYVYDSQNNKYYILRAVIFVSI